jgi:hypothetical protein
MYIYNIRKQNTLYLFLANYREKVKVTLNFVEGIKF